MYLQTQIIPFVFIILDLGTISQATPKIHKGSTVLDSLKDGFDSVYKFESNFVISHLKVNQFEGQTFDVHLRQSSIDDRVVKFLMYVEKTQVQGTHEQPPTEADLASLKLPLLVTLVNDDMDVDKIYASDKDTKLSLNWKHDAIFLMTDNFTELLHDSVFALALVKQIELSSQIKGLQFGDCRMKFQMKVVGDKIALDITARRKDCVGELSQDLVDQFKEFDATDVSNDSVIQIGYLWDKETLCFRKSFLKMKGTTVSGMPMVFKITLSVEFDRYEEITEEIDEEKLTKIYEEADIK